MQIQKVKLKFNLKPRKEILRSYMSGEMDMFAELCTDDHASHFEPNEEGVSFRDRYLSFLYSPMKKGDEVDVQVLEEFISDLDNRADIDMNGQGDWETEEDEEYLYYIGGSYFQKLAERLKKLYGNLLSDK